jgi:ankyrin repeat protein
VNELDPARRTQLHYASLTNDVPEIRRLFASGADANIVDAQGFSPLHLAAQEYAIEAARELLSSGAVVDARNLWGNTPLFVAVFNSRGRGEMIELLRSHGADPLAANKSGQTPVGLARLIGNYDVARYFADLG